MASPVDTRGFVEAYRHYLKRPDRQILSDYESFLEDQRVYHDILKREVERWPSRMVDLLEIGSGSGCTTTLVSSWPTTRILAVDVVPEALECTRRTMKVCHSPPRKVACAMADGTRLPCRDASMDLIYHQGLLEHFRDTAPLLDESRRVLKPGGSLVVNVPQTYSWYTVKKWIQMRRGRWSPGWETSHTAGSLRRLARDHGFTVARVTGQTYDSKWAELRKGYRRWFKPWAPKTLENALGAAWQNILDRHGHRFLLEIIAVFRKL